MIEGNGVVLSFLVLLLKKIMTKFLQIVISKLLESVLMKFTNHVRFAINSLKGRIYGLSERFKRQRLGTDQASF